MTIKYIGNGIYLAFGKYLGNPCLCEAGSHYEAFMGCLELMMESVK